MGDMADMYADWDLFYEDDEWDDELRYTEMVRETEKSWCIRPWRSKKTLWFPKSQCYLVEGKVGGKYICGPRWLFERKRYEL